MRHVGLILFINLTAVQCEQLPDYTFQPEDISSFTPDTSEILAIDSFENTLAVVTTQHIKLYTVTDPPKNSIQLMDEMLLPEELDRTREFVEFKLLAMEEIVICDNTSCSLCVFSYDMNYCQTLNLQLNETSTLKYASVTINQHHIVLQTVDSNQQAAIYLFELNDTGSSVIDVKHISLDSSSVTDQVTLTAFSTGKYSYFVNSANFKHDPNVAHTPSTSHIVKFIRLYLNADMSGRQYRVDEANSGTNSCGDYKLDTEAILAALYEDHHIIFITQANGTLNVCRSLLYDLDVHLFDNAVYRRMGNAEKRKLVPDHAIETYGRSIFSTMSSIDFSVVCDEFSAGNITITTLYDSIHENVLLACSLRNTTNILRVGYRDEQMSIIPKMHLNATLKYHMIALKNTILYILGKTIEYVSPDCSMYYKTCDMRAEDQYWTTIMHCEWCHNEGTERAGHRMYRNCSTVYSTFCPPIVNNVTISCTGDGSKITIMGKGFSYIAELHVDVPDYSCDGKIYTDDRISCDLNDVETTEMCLSYQPNINVSGIIETAEKIYYSFQISKDKIVNAHPYYDSALEAASISQKSKRPICAQWHWYRVACAKNDQLYMFDNADRELTGDITSAAKVTLEVLDLKFVHGHQIAYCDLSACRICLFQKVAKQFSCFEFDLNNSSHNGSFFTEAKISISKKWASNSEKAITLRLVDNHGTTFTFVYHLNGNTSAQLLSMNTITHRNELQILSASNGDPAYFLENYAVSNSLLLNNRTILLTRVLLRKNTTELERYKDIEVGCSIAGNTTAYFFFDYLFVCVEEGSFNSGLICRFNITDLNEQFDKSETHNNPIIGTTVGRYHSLPGPVIKITVVLGEALYLTTTGGVYYIPLIFDKRESRIPMSYHFSEEYMADHIHIIAAKVYYAVHESKVTRHLFQCSGFFGTCESFKARIFDPLRCVWCVELNEALEHDGICNTKLTNVCPAFVSNVSQSHNYTQWFFTGVHMDTLENKQLLICDEHCNITDKTTSTQLSCFMGAGLIRNRSCEVVLSGTLENEPFTFEKTESFSFGLDPSELPYWVAITVTIGVLFIVILMLYLTISGSREYQAIQRNIFENKRQNEYGQLFQKLDDHIKIQLSSLSMEAMIGEGKYGFVRRATYKLKNGTNLIVACKMIKEGGFTEVFREVVSCQTMERLHHQRVVKFIGMALDEDSMPIIVTAFMKHGDLRKYLESYGKCNSKADLITFALQIAEGMEYLHSQKFIHRDLAARNCMLDEHLSIKIGDFGLARECNNEHGYEPTEKRYLPVAWMSLEVLQENIFSFKLDVWSYGVVLWEIFSNGETPYSDLKGGLMSYLQTGLRLKKPIECPEDMYNNIMLPCWSAEMNDRREFSDLVLMVREILRTTDISNEPFIPANDHSDGLQWIEDQ